MEVGSCATSHSSLSLSLGGCRQRLVWVFLHLRNALAEQMSFGSQSAEVLCWLWLLIAVVVEVQLSCLQRKNLAPNATASSCHAQTACRVTATPC